MGQELSGPIGHLTNHLTKSTLHLAGTTSAAAVTDKDAESTNSKRTLKVTDLTEGDLRELLTNAYIMKLAPYIRCRSEIGSPCIASHSCSQEEIERFQKENDGFPLPSTKEDLEAFDQAAFIYQPLEHLLISSSPEPPASPSSPASPPGTVLGRTDKTRGATVPDFHVLRTKLQKIQSPTRPKFIDHLITRVSSSRARRKNRNGLIICQSADADQDENIVKDLLPPNTGTHLEEASELVQEILSGTCKRPASGESSDSGNGTLLDSASDFSPTPHSVWSTPASPKLDGIVKRRLKNFQKLESPEEQKKINCIKTYPLSLPSSPRAYSKPFHGMVKKDKISKTPCRQPPKSEWTSDNLRKFYSTFGRDENFSATVMEKGYVRTLVEKINHHGLPSDLSEETITQNGSCSRQEDSSDSSLQESHSCGEIDCRERDRKLSESVSSREGSSCKQSDTETGDKCLVNSENIMGAESLPINSNGADHSLPPNVEVTNTVSSAAPCSHCPALCTCSRTIVAASLSSSFSSPILKGSPTSKVKGQHLWHRDQSIALSQQSIVNSLTSSAMESCAINENEGSCKIGGKVSKSDPCGSEFLDHISVLPLSPEELFEQNWSRSEINFDDFSDDGEICDKAFKKGPKEEEEEEEPKCKLFKIAEELLKTERSYVSRLHLLDQVFHFKITVENKNASFMPEEVITQMFSNVKSIYKFHNDFLLPQLTERMFNWSKEAKIGDLMKRFAPFLKMYTEYVKNFDHAMELINQWLVKSPRFATLIQDIQQLPECGHLTLQHHMLEPVQRVPRYELLLKDYLKRLPEDASDRTDAEAALKLVTEAASHSNTVMKKIEKFHKVMSIYQALGGGIDLISPTRELIKEGRIIKISARSGEKQDRYLFLFNDLLLVCSEQILGSYKLRARMSVDGMEVRNTIDENHSISKSFIVKSVEKSVEFLDENSKSGEQEWETVIHKVISDYKSKSLSRVNSNPIDPEVLDNEQDKIGILGKKAPQWIKDDAVTMCMVCTQQFTALKRRHHCRACGKVVCGKCSPRKIKLEYDNSQLNKVCTKCYDLLSKDNTRDQLSEEDSKKKGILQKAACEPSIIAGYLNVLDKGRNWSRRWIALRSDFVMYLYKAHQDVVAMTALPLPGYNSLLVDETEKIDKTNVFKLCHKNLDTFYFQADTETKVKQWVKVLEKMVLLQLPNEEEMTETNRLSSASTSSTTSTNSDC